MDNDLHCMLQGGDVATSTLHVGFTMRCAHATQRTAAYAWLRRRRGRRYIIAQHNNSSSQKYCVVVFLLSRAAMKDALK